MMTLSGTMQPPNIKPRHSSHTLWVRHIALFEQASEPPADIDGVEKVLGLWESWVFVQYPTQRRININIGTRSSKLAHAFISVDGMEGPRTLKRTFAACIRPLLGNTNCLGVV
jgi:hypothetical protein